MTLFGKLASTGTFIMPQLIEFNYGMSANLNIGIWELSPTLVEKLPIWLVSTRASSPLVLPSSGAWTVFTSNMTPYLP